MVALRRVAGFFPSLFVCFALLLTGCGNGHEGGPIDTSENPFQVSDSEQQRMNAANRVPDDVIEQASEGDGSAADSEATLDSKPDPLGDSGDLYDPQ
ncbi:MAG: hypothetical protein AAF802_11300 [Planctomycetota bacterium]